MLLSSAADTRASRAPPAVVSVQALSTRIAFLENALGSALAPFDCWLLLRGVKTMAVSSKH